MGASHNRPPVTLLAPLLPPPSPSPPPPKTRIHGNLKTKCDAILKSVIDASQMDSLRFERD